jgi:hypothetical protein
MGFLSSFFGFGDKPTTTSSNVISEYPEELKEYIEQAMAANKAIYEQRLGEGYKPYTGQTIAGFTPEEIASQEGLKSLVGSQGVLQQEALDLARGADRKFTSETAKEYMSPYLRTALDSQKQEAQRQYERTAVPEFERQAVAAGGMSGLGSRAGVEAAERATGQNRLLSSIEAAGQQKAFEASQEAFRDQTTRERQAASQISTAAPNIFKSALSEQGLLQTMGEQKRDLGQSTLDEAYLKYIEQQQFPESQLARYQSSIYGNPLLKQPNYSKSGTGGGGGPSFGKTLFGLGSAALGFGTGGGGGSSFFNMFKSGGGGIGSTMKAQEYVNRNMGGPVMPPVMYRQENGSVMSREDTIKEIDRLELLKKDRLKRLAGRAKFGQRKSTPPEQEQTIVTPGGVRIPVNPQVNLPLDDEFAEEGGYYGGLSTLSDGTGQSTPDATQADIDKFLQAQGNKQGITAGDRTDQEDAGMVIKGYINGEPVYGPPPSALPDPGKETGPSGMTSPKEAAQIATTAAEKVAKNTFDSALVMQNINKKTSTEVKGLLNSFAEKYKARAKSDPYKMQKFWFTVSANIMKKGNAFANMAEGLRIAVNDLDTTRKEKDKLLMDLEDTMTKSKIKLAGKEGESNIAYEKLNLTQKNMIAKLGTTGLAAFNKQMKENGDYIAALAAAKKADNAARKIDAKERKEGQLNIADQVRLTGIVTERLSDIAGGYFRKGASIGVKATKYKRDLDNAFQDMYFRKGKKAADDFLAFTLKQDMPNFSKMFSKKTKK